MTQEVIMRIIKVIGLHNTGKTTAVENIIKYIKKENLTVSSIKDIHQDNFTMEKEGSNSQRHLKASQSYVFARGKKETYLVWNKQLNLSEMLTHIDTDWLIIEGMKEEKLPTIIAAKQSSDIDGLLDENVIAITGAFSETTTEYKGIPVINAITDIDKLGNLILNKINNTLPKINIKFNGKDVPINKWVEQVSFDLIVSFCKNLKGYKIGDEIEIKIKETMQNGNNNPKNTP